MKKIENLIRLVVGDRDEFYGSFCCKKTKIEP